MYKSKGKGAARKSTAATSKRMPATARFSSVTAACARLTSPRTRPGWGRRANVLMCTSVHFCHCQLCCDVQMYQWYFSVTCAYYNAALRGPESANVVSLPEIQIVAYAMEIILPGHPNCSYVSYAIVSLAIVFQAMMRQPLLKTPT